MPFTNVEDRRAWAKEYRAKNREHIREVQKAWRVKHPDKWLTYSQKWREANPDYMRRYDLAHKYGISITEFEAMLKKQNGKCAICGRILSLKSHRADSVTIDHDHKTKVVRGLLCFECNLGLGYFKDAIPSLKTAIAYLAPKRD